MRVQFGLILGSLLAVHAISANTQHERSRVAASAPRRLQHRQPLASLSLLRRAGPTLNPGDACQNPDQCLSGGCDNGVCDYSVVGKGCVMNSDCRQGTCQQGLCYFLPPSAACTADSQCVSNACTTGTCAPISGSAGASCLTGLDCPSLSCTNFVCDASTQGQACNAASDCAVTIQGQGPCLYNRCFGFFNECTDRTMCFDGICRGSASEKYCYGRDSDPCDWNAQCSSQVCDAQDTGMCVGGPRVLTPPPAPTTSSTTSTPTSTSTSTSISTSTSSTTSTTSTTTSSTATSTTTSTTSSTSSATSTVSSTSTSSASTSKSSSSSSSSSSSTTTMPTTTTTSSSSTTRTSTATTSTTSGLPTGASCTTNANCSTGYCRKALLSDGVTRASTGTCSVKRTDGSPCYQNVSREHQHQHDQQGHLDDDPVLHQDEDDDHFGHEVALSGDLHDEHAM
ncbi:hypothetical protein OC846_003851 [Tilletia horrida]|uniref:Uncharacterized protein n=1 Tax=Tilletia horrida TaxID=155126 RepID=A0AAN6GPA5_9BASI|nr:hypothetical protein OC846_003851 [Tilletia horrida]